MKNKYYIIAALAAVSFALVHASDIDQKLISDSSVWIKPITDEASIGLIAKTRIAVQVTDKLGGILYRGFVDPSEIRYVPRRGDLTLTTEEPEQLQLEIKGSKWSMMDPRTNSYLKTVVIHDLSQRPM